jgi:hypothetical protein
LRGERRGRNLARRMREAAASIANSKSEARNPKQTAAK